MQNNTCRGELYQIKFEKKNEIRNIIVIVSTHLLLKTLSQFLFEQSTVLSSEPSFNVSYYLCVT